jgi:hypothetical protein
MLRRCTLKFKPGHNSQHTTHPLWERGERELAGKPLAGKVSSSLGREDMEEATVTAATGTLGPVIAKLAALLGSEYKLRWRTRRDVKFIRSKLKPVHSILWNIW